MKTNYKTVKAKVASILATTVLAATQVYSQGIEQITTQYNQDHPIEIASLSSRPARKESRLKLMVGSGNSENLENASIGIKYTSNNFKEFLWGLSRPVHFYNTNPTTGRKEILPFWNPKHACKAGGIVSPISGVIAYPVNYIANKLGKDGDLIPKAWENGPALTAGVAVDYIIAGALASSSGSSGSSGNSEPAQDYVALATTTTSSSTPTPTVTPTSSTPTPVTPEPEEPSGDGHDPNHDPL